MNHLHFLSCYTGKPQDDLVPPSHFASSVHAATLATGTQPCISWMKPSVPAAPPKDPWLGGPNTQREILTQRKENQCTVMLQGHNTRGRTPEENVSDLRTRYSTTWFIWSKILSAGGLGRYTNSSICSNTDPKREATSGPDGKKSGVWRQKSTKRRLSGWRSRWRPWRTLCREIGKRLESKTTP